MECQAVAPGAASLDRDLLSAFVAAAGVAGTALMADPASVGNAFGTCSDQFAFCGHDSGMRRRGSDGSAGVAKGRRAGLQGSPREGPELARKPSFHCDSDDCQVSVSHIGQNNRAVAGVA